MGTPAGVTEQSRTPQWRQRRLATAALTVLVAIAPMLLAVAAGVLASRMLLPSPQTTFERVAGVLAGVSVSAAVLFALERAARRLLPLVMLMRLSLTFPDRAPSRLAIALRAGNLMRTHNTLIDENDTTPTAQSQAEILITLVAALHTHDRRTRGHSERVRALTDLVAEEMDLAPEDANRLRWAALLHDIGKIDVPASIINKRGTLDPAEFTVMTRHPDAGARLAGPLAEWLGEWRHAIDQHHEKFDGTGYPRQLARYDISDGGRIVSVTDAFETMTAVRSYKKAMPVRDARAELVDAAGTHFDPDVVRAFLAISLPRLYRVIGPLAMITDVPLLTLLSTAGARFVQVAAAFAVPALAGAVAFLAAPAVVATGNADVVIEPPAAHAPPAPGANATDDPAATNDPGVAAPAPGRITPPTISAPRQRAETVAQIASGLVPIVTGIIANLPPLVPVLAPVIPTITSIVPQLPVLPTLPHR